MLKTYKDIISDEAEAQKARDRARVLDALTREKTQAENLVKRLIAAVESPDEDSVMMEKVVEIASRLDSKYVTRSGSFGIGLPGGLPVAHVLMTAAGFALSQARAHRAGLEAKLPEAEKALADAIKNLERYHAKLDAEERERVA